MVIEPKEYTFDPMPVDEWLFATIDKKPEDQESKYDKAKRVLVVLFRIEQDFELNGKNVRGQKIPRIFPINWPSDKSKKDPLLYQFVSVVAPELAVKNSNFDSDDLEGKTCFIMIEDVKREDGSVGQKVVKWKAAKKSATAPKPAAKAKVAATVPDDGETVDY